MSQQKGSAVDDARKAVAWQVMVAERGLGRYSYIVADADGLKLPMTEDQAFLMASAPEMEAKVSELEAQLRQEREKSTEWAGIAGTHAGSIELLQAQLRQERHEFQNFHEQLCKRFGYGHDPVDWKRDQVSLIEHVVRSSGSVARKELDVAWTERNELLKKYCDRTTEAIELQAQLRQEREAMRFFRARIFGPRTHNPGCHNTACAIWGDDGQGGTAENFPQPLPCTCGCLKDWAEEQLRQEREAGAAHKLLAIEVSVKRDFLQYQVAQLQTTVGQQRKILLGALCLRCGQGEPVIVNSAGYYSHQEEGNCCNAHRVHAALATCPAPAKENPE